MIVSSNVSGQPHVVWLVHQRPRRAARIISRPRFRVVARATRPWTGGGGEGGREKESETGEEMRSLRFSRGGHGTQPR